MKISDHFQLEEFVPPNVFQTWGANAVWFVDPRLIELAEFVRTFFNKPVIINDWHRGGQLQYRCFRDQETNVGAKLSQHRMGRAMDFNISGMTPQEVYSAILANSGAFMKAGLTSMEDISATPTWTHIDIRQLTPPTIKIVQPL